MSKVGGENIWERVCDVRVLFEAFEKVHENEGGPGGDGVTVGAFRMNLAANLAYISNGLRDGSYQPQAHRRVGIPKRNGEVRMLTIPSVADRVVHCAIALVLEPILEPQFENCSFAYRKGRSVKQAVARIEWLRDKGYSHVVEADINDYFNSLDHAILLDKLKSALTGHVGSEAIVRFLADDLIHQSSALETTGRGIVQGSPLSPLLANLYLDALDEAIEGQGVQIVRFADDFVVLSKTESRAENALAHIKQVLAEHHLTLHERKTGLVTFDDGFEFLGHMFVRTLATKKQTAKRPKAVTRAISLNSDHRATISDATVDDDAERAKDDGRYSRGGHTAHVREAGRRIVLRNESYSIVDADGEEIAALAQGRVDRLEIGPDVSAEWDVVRQCMSTGTDLAVVNGWGETLGWLLSAHSPLANRQLLQAQAVSNEEFRLGIARKIVDARIRNQRTQLFRLNRQKQLEAVSQVLVAMARNFRKLPFAEDIDQVRGLEGASAAMYWPALGLLCEGLASPLKRTRPAADPFNAVVNYLCALLERDIRAAIQKAGLHTGFGFLHSTRDRSDAFVYDLMEPFRAPLTEGLAVFLFNAHRLRPDMFEMTEAGIRLGAAAIRAIIVGYEQFVAKRVNITGGGGKLAWKPLMLQQARSVEAACRKRAYGFFEPYLMEA